MVVPNEHVVGTEIFNHSTGNLGAPIVVYLWLPPGGDVPAARRALDGIAEHVQLERADPRGREARAAPRTSTASARGSAARRPRCARRRHSALREAGLLEFA